MGGWSCVSGWVVVCYASIVRRQSSTYTFSLGIHREAQGYVTKKGPGMGIHTREHDLTR